MLEKLEPLEIKIVEKVFERFSHWTERWFGLNCFFWAYICNFIVTCRLIFDIYIAWNERKWGETAIQIISSILVFAFNLITIKRAKKSVSQTNTIVFKNPYLLLASSSRVIFLMFILLTSINAYIKHVYPWTAFFFSCVYMLWAFAACTPLPPRKSKLRKIIESLGESAKSMLSPGGAEPQPA
jgi:hypothetical protein